MSDENKEEKQYGLVVPGKNRLSIPKPGNIFGEESGSDGDEGTDWVRKALRAEGEKNLVKKQTQLTMKRALKEDPTVYQYDEVYDDIERSKEKEKTSKKTVEKKAKYIENLLKAADRRKREQEHRVERMVQKEREDEGAKFADKESFVTSAYRAKLEEFKKMEDEEKRMDRLEAIGDVTKQQDISGFYRHLYRQTVDGGEKQTEVEAKEARVEAPVAIENVDVDDPQTTDSEEKSEHENGGETIAKGTNKRQYRKRMAEESQSSSESEMEKEEKETAEKRRKLSSDGEKIDNETKKRRDSGESKPEKIAPKVEKDKEQEEEKEDKPKAEEPSIKKSKKIEPELPKINIWEKRTVGPLFEAALERYYARKAARFLG